MQGMLGFSRLAYTKKKLIFIYRRVCVCVCVCCDLSFSFLVNSNCQGAVNLFCIIEQKCFGVYVYIRTVMNAICVVVHVIRNSLS